MRRGWNPVDPLITLPICCTNRLHANRTDPPVIKGCHQVTSPFPVKPTLASPLPSGLTPTCLWQYIKNENLLWMNRYRHGLSQSLAQIFWLMKHPHTCDELDSLSYLPYKNTNVLWDAPGVPVLKSLVPLFKSGVRADPSDVPLNVSGVPVLKTNVPVSLCSDPVGLFGVPPTASLVPVLKSGVAPCPRCVPVDVSVDQARTSDRRVTCSNRNLATSDDHVAGSLSAVGVSDDPVPCSKRRVRPSGGEGARLCNND